MIKKLAVSGILLTIVIAAVSAGKPVKSKEPAPTESLKLVSHVYPPFSYKSNGVIDGALVKVMSAICSEAKISCTTEMHSFQESMQLVATGEADVIFTLTVNEDPEERNEKILYASTPIVRSSYAFFVPYDSRWTWDTGSDEISDFTIYSFGPSATSLVAQETKPKSVVLSSSNIMAFQNLIMSPKGTKVAVVVNKDAGDFMLSQGSIRGPKYAGSIKDAFIGFGFSRKSKNMHLYRPMLNATNKLLADKTISKILTANKPPLLPAYGTATK
jgi:ABC-type amino acid transport substrate-binding protein